MNRFVPTDVLFLIDKQVQDVVDSGKATAMLLDANGMTVNANQQPFWGKPGEEITLKFNVGKGQKPVPVQYLVIVNPEGFPLLPIQLGKSFIISAFDYVTAKLTMPPYRKWIAV